MDGVVGGRTTLAPLSTSPLSVLATSLHAFRLQPPPPRGAPTIACRPRRHGGLASKFALLSDLLLVISTRSSSYTCRESGRKDSRRPPSDMRPTSAVNSHLDQIPQKSDVSGNRILASRRPLDAPTQVGRFPDKTKGSQQSKKGGTFLLAIHSSLCTGRDYIAETHTAERRVST